MDVTSVEKDESEKLVVTEEEKKEKEACIKFLTEKTMQVRNEEDRVLVHRRARDIYKVIEENLYLVDREKMVTALMNSEDVDAIEYVCKLVELMKYTDNLHYIDISKIQDYIVRSGKSKYIIWFACNVPNANIDKLEDVIIATGDAEDMYNFFVELRAYKKNVNVGRLVNAIIATKDAEYIYKLALALQLGFGINYQSIDVDRDIEYMKFVKEFVLASKSRIKASDDYVRELENAMVNTYGNKFIGLFARDISGADVGRLENVIIDREDAVSAALFPRYVKPQNLGAIEDIVIESNNSSIIYDYYRSVGKNCIDIVRLVYALMNDLEGKWCIYHHGDLQYYLSHEDLESLLRTIHESIKENNAKQMAKQMAKQIVDL